MSFHVAIKFVKKMSQLRRVTGYEGEEAILGCFTLEKDAEQRPGRWARVNQVKTWKRAFQDRSNKLKSP